MSSKLLRYLIAFLMRFSTFFPTAYGNGNRVKFLEDTKIIVPNHPQVAVVDQTCDQGYGSERSPEDEIPPPLPIVGFNQQPQYNQMLVNSMMMAQGQQMIDIQRPHPQAIIQSYDFITEGEFKLSSIFQLLIWIVK